MKKRIKRVLPSAIALALLGGTGAASAAVFVQCPGDIDGDAAWDSPGEVQPPNVRCKHLIAGDSFVNMSDGNPLYTFGFGEQTGTPPDQVIGAGILDAEWPGPVVELEEGEEFYLSLTNVGTVIRPDLFDPHTVHWHGFPNAATVFDGVPEVSVSINMGATLTYYYNVLEPGTYMYHCHVEASEHMEMGMLANLYVHPKQDFDGCLSGLCIKSNRGRVIDGELTDPAAPEGYVYNDDDGTTGWDVEAPIQVSSFDAKFHDASYFVQPLPFALLEANYPMINGRGYPDTVKPGDLLPPTDNVDPVPGFPEGTISASGKMTGNPGEVLNNGTPTQTMDSVISVSQGDTLLLRLSNVSIDRFFTLTAQGLTMKIVGTGARQMRGVDGKNLYREVASVNFGGGETNDVLIDTADVAPGTYFLYATELHQMSNLSQLDGGLITEIVVN